MVAVPQQQQALKASVGSAHIAVSGGVFTQQFIEAMMQPAGLPALPDRWRQAEPASSPPTTAAQEYGVSWDAHTVHRSRPLRLRYTPA